MPLTEKERITLLMMRGYGDRVRSFMAVATLFNNTYPERAPISGSTVKKTLRRFQETGSVKDRPRIGRPRTARSVDTSMEVMVEVVEDPHASTRKISQAVGIGKSSVHEILQNEKWHPYKITLTQELNECDLDRRIEFCEEMMRRYDQNNNFFENIIFSDEAAFELNGEMNRHNCRYWSDDNPHWTSDIHTQYPQKLNVWAGFCGRGIIGPFFIEGTLTGQKYLDLLQLRIVPAIFDLVGREETWFQQDGAAPHYAARVREYLNEVFPERWIGRRGEIEWPARSPDMTPLDFFLWGYVKNNVYKTKPANVDELKERIMDQINGITPEMRGNVLKEFYFRLGYCQEAGGGQFEHLIR